MKRDVAIISTLAWRNVWRNKRRTILTLLTVIVGCAMIILLNAFAKGGHDRMIEDATGMVMGHIHIHENGYWENKTIDYAFFSDTKIKTVLNTIPIIQAYCTRIMCDALIAKGATTKGVMIQGVEPSSEIKVSQLHTTIVHGRYLNDSDTTHAVIGATLAENLKVNIGDTVAIISQGFDGSIAAEHLVVVGIFKSGNPEYDKFLLQMPMKQADETFSMMGYVHAIVIRATTIDAVDDIVEALSNKLGIQFEVLGWEKLMPELVQFIVMDDVSGFLFDLMLFLVVAFGILNTIQMSVYERTRELGIMKAVGTTPQQIIALILTETFYITVIGVVLGVALGVSISYYFTVHPIDYSQFADEIAVWGISTTIFPATVTIANIITTSIITLGVSLFFCIFPARRAAKLHPVEAIRHI
ncbi:MAG: ABC transporter permease [Spirochaetes bacterium]|nr:ABC transporter permease [Spirochaetota bacterium]